MCAGGRGSGGFGVSAGSCCRPEPETGVCGRQAGLQSGCANGTQPAAASTHCPGRPCRGGGVRPWRRAAVGWTAPNAPVVHLVCQLNVGDERRPCTAKHTPFTKGGWRRAGGAHTPKVPGGLIKARVKEPSCGQSLIHTLQGCQLGGPAQHREGGQRHERHGCRTHGCAPGPSPPVEQI